MGEKLGGGLPYRKCCVRRSRQPSGKRKVRKFLNVLFYPINRHLSMPILHWLWHEYLFEYLVGLVAFYCSFMKGFLALLSNLSYSRMFQTYKECGE